MKKKNRYTIEQIEFLRSGYLSITLPCLVDAFNIQFGLKRTVVQIQSTLKRYGIFCGRKPKDRLRARFIKYTNEQAVFLRDNYPGHSAVELTNMFNDKFGTNKKPGQIGSFVKNRGIRSGIDCRFQPGEKPWNTGTKGMTGANSTSYKKGNIPANRKPIGSERACSKGGPALIKIMERNPYTGAATRYKSKQIYIWEQANGPVPDGMVVAFRDSDNSKIEIENLMLISRAELLILNQYDYKNTPAELKPSVLALSKLEAIMFAAQNNQINGG